MEVPIPLGFESPPLGFRFGVYFFTQGADLNSLDILFQRVSGLTATVSTRAVQEGGQNLYTQRLPENIQYDNLVLERGLLIGSPLAREFNDVISLFTFRPSNVLVSLLSEASEPLASWLLLKAYPVRWSVSEFDATANAVVIETMELAYQRMQVMSI